MNLEVLIEHQPTASRRSNHSSQPSPRWRRGGAAAQSWRGRSLVALLVLFTLAACRVPSAGAPVAGDRSAAGPTDADVASPAPTQVVTGASTATPTLTPEPSATATATPGPGLEELLGTPQAAYTNADLVLAEAVYDELATLYPHSAEPGIGQAAVALREGDVDEARRALETAVEADSTDLEAWRRLAVIYEQQERYGEAVEAYGAMIDVSPADPDLYIARGMAEARLGQGEAAATDMKQAQALDPTREYAWLNVSGAAYGNRSYDTAVEILSGGIDAYPDSVDLLVLRGKAYLAAGDAEAALADLDAAVAAADDNISAHHWRGVALAELGRSEEAVAAFKRAGELGAEAGASSFAEAFEAMARAARIMARTDPQAAYVYLQDASIAYGQPPPILFGYALIEYERGNLGGALDSLTRLIDLYTYAPAYYWRAKINAELGNVGPAREDLEWYLNVRQAGPEAEEAHALLESLGN